jgi:hypothetical protein
MRELETASSDDMVLAFVRAEIDSPVWGPAYMKAITSLRLERSVLIDQADLKDCRMNSVRAAVLGAVRGFGHNAFLFAGFPRDAQWRRVLVEPPDFDGLTYANCEPFRGLTDETRLINDGARNYKRVPAFAARVDEIKRDIRAGLSAPDLILVEDRNRLVVLEGNTRATARVQISTPFSALVGSSPTMREWVYV